jgi:hypothetical protein
MIPNNINAEHILKAIEAIKRRGTRRPSTKYYLLYNNEYFPPKEIISLANKYANGREILPGEFSGGKETNSFLERLGFTVVEKGAVKEPGNDSSANGKSTDKSNSISSNDRVKPDNGNLSKLSIATVVIESPGAWAIHESSKNLIETRLELMRFTIREYGSEADILLFPAGFLNTHKNPDELIDRSKKAVPNYLNEFNSNSHVCFGIDGRFDKDQLGISINQSGIVAFARKFYPTDSEKVSIELSPNASSGEMGYPRTFSIKGKHCYIAVCYDSYGIRKKSVSNPGVDIILNLVHRFHKPGEGPSGDVYFARDGFAGASKQWSCPIFGAAIFFDRSMPPNWPTGVRWNRGNQSTKDYKYEHNPILQTPAKELGIEKSPEKAIVRLFSI